ncbi:MAG TPA: hypothetical protein VHT24_01695 [Pseudacidobacterium sp.]|jgi:protein-L-isoaspartate O-methyltransferase|nr:hypothetical protein [Pseudacidobacterium sp.]
MVNWVFIRQVGPVQWATRYSSLQFRKRILKKDSYLKLPTGLTLLLPRQSGFSTEAFVANANVDWGAESILLKFADRDQDFLDIGSHIGYYSAYLAPCTRRVYSF